MTADWMDPHIAAMLQALDGSAHPAWLWSADGQELVWHNEAADLFCARFKKKGLKPGRMAVPIKGQVPRLMRLGAFDQPSLSRVRFLAGKKPISATCKCTPLRLDRDRAGLLLVGIEPLEAEILEAAGIVGEDTPAEPEVSESGFATENPSLAGTETTADAEAGSDAGDEPLTTAPEHEDWVEDETAEDSNEAVEVEDAATPSAEVTDTDRAGLTSLLDRLADDENLFTPLGPDDDIAPVLAAEGHRSDQAEQTEAGFEPLGDEDEQHGEHEGVESASDVAEDQADIHGTDEGWAEDTVEDPDRPVLWRITGRGFTPAAITDAGTAGEAETPQSSRYNFEELSRILNDRIGPEGPGETEMPPMPQQGVASGALINLGDENLVLNRLPLGLLIFRADEIVFANRAFADLLGYDDIASLRAAGIGSVFSSDAEEHAAGPVSQLMDHAGHAVAVTARLQTVTWQGRPAFLLSARQLDRPADSEKLVPQIAEELAEMCGDGFIETNVHGVITALSSKAAGFIGRSAEALVGQPISNIIREHEMDRLRGFLDQPAQTAHTNRPVIGLELNQIGKSLTLATLGRAGVVTGYFGLVKSRGTEQTQSSGQTDAGLDINLLKRLDRNLRRPLNTIIGFADLIANEQFGPIENSRYVEYARDIGTAGAEMAGGIDELNTLLRIDSGEYEPDTLDLDLGGLLEQCVLTLRTHAANGHVLLRSAISERLPHVRADAASVKQALMNLMISAISQSPEGGQVVVSAGWEADGSLGVHIRDSSASTDDWGERFMVYRSGVDESGAPLAPQHSSLGLALTRSLLAVNGMHLDVEMMMQAGSLFAIAVPAELTVQTARA